MEHKYAAASTPAERAALYDRLMDEGANPDEAAQGAGWKNYNSAYNCLIRAGIQINRKTGTHAIIDATGEPIAKPKPTVINQDFEDAFAAAEAEISNVAATVIDTPEGRCTMEDVVEMIKTETLPLPQPKHLKIAYKGAACRYDLDAARSTAFIEHGYFSMTLTRSMVIDMAAELAELAELMVDRP